MLPSLVMLMSVTIVLYVVQKMYFVFMWLEGVGWGCSVDLNDLLYIYTNIHYIQTV